MDVSLGGGTVLMDPQLMADREAMRTLLKFSLIVVASVPMLAIYPFIQKYFNKGLMIGAVKG
jgi:multiple sugar transport system permease protein/putative aldouronate transport system permease protein